MLWPRRVTLLLCYLSAAVLLASCWRINADTVSSQGEAGHGATAGSPGQGGTFSGAGASSGSAAGSGSGAGSGAGAGASGASGSPVGSGAQGGDGPGEIPKEICRFSDEMAFKLPSGFAADQLDDLAEDSGGTCFEGELSYRTLDMNGDLRPDLVLADDCDFANVGSTHWLVYLNEDGGFAAAPLQWQLPAGFATDQLDDLADDSGATCFEGELSFATLDMNGDLRPDLVIADDCDFAAVGSTHWLVYLNEGDGFAAAPLQWQLPSGFATDQLDDLADDSGATCFEGKLSFGTLDLNGDLRPDLVIANDCDIGDVGTTHWLVYLNEGDGFAAAPVEWQLPSGFATDQLDGLARDGGGTCFQGELSFGTLDMNGDLRPDLVIADACDIGDVGTTHWLVYLNEGSGFAAAPVEWKLPAGFATDQLDDLAKDSGGTCFQGELSFTVRDADGDLLADLLIADDCDFAHTGTTHWVLYRGTGSGFESAGGWLLPGSDAGFSFDALDDPQGDGGGLCAQGELSFAAIDMTGDRVLDLVVADDCDFEDTGTTHWRMFKGSCD